MSPLPVEGLRVLDLSRLLPGPFCTLCLADFGAEVIKVEDIARGDGVRQLPPLQPGSDVGAWHLLLNRGKQSVALNLKDPRGKVAFLRLADTADVLLEGFRPGVMGRLGLDYPALSARNPRLIYCSLTGYGQDGPYAQLAGHDLNYLGLAGVLDLLGPADGAPIVPGVQIADLGGGGQLALIGILFALLARATSGVGQYIDVAMLDGSFAWLQRAATLAFATGMQPRRGNFDLAGKYACYNVYACRDGGYLAVGALEEPFWATLCRQLGLSELIPLQYDDARRAEVLAAVQARFLERTRDEWFAELRQLDACVTPVRSVSEALADPHFRARGLLLEAADPRHGLIRELGQPFRMSAATPRPPLPAPELGEHTDAVLGTLGYSAAELATLRAERVIR
jgi:crotonobetainyl-CoA:carnitine CoA-transferase CaiB-like acyl-CoA transferase